jgi:hypothetical protein
MTGQDDTAAAEDPELARRIAEARPVVDDLTRSVWLARVSSALFGADTTKPVTVGRYRLERQLGRGGGGSVFVANDPELHRDIAVKLIRFASERHRQRALAEARALAKLSHPNIVPIHDIGETSEHVYMVMELLRGESLRAYAAHPERTVRELVAAYRQAASGLAAAHAIGIVHRDFKPDNAMFGEDGRLRVVDFGLAAGGDAEALVGGTPRYMAPEQRGSEPATPAVDQYALAVSLREGVTGHDRGEPAWLARVLARATAERPEDRYPSLDALARALGDDPRARWRRRALIATPVILAAIGFGVGRRATTGGIGEACAGGGEALAPAWTRARVDAISGKIERLGTPLAIAIAPQIRARATKLGDEWLAAHHASCVAHVRGELTAELYDRATVCLARSRAGIGETMQLLDSADAAQLDTAVTALAVVDRADKCADPIMLETEAGSLPTPALRAIDQQIEIAAVHARAATATAVTLGEQAVAAARGSGDQRLLARALLVLGHALMPVDLERAVAPLHEAMRIAVVTGQDEVMAEAFARHAFAKAQTSQAAPMIDGLELAQLIGERARERGAFARALLANNTGAIAFVSGDFPQARQRYLDGIAAAKQVRGPGSTELATTITNLAMVTPDAKERARLYDEALAIIRAAVGPDHKLALEKQLLMISNRENPRQVADELAALCPRIAALYPNLLPIAKRCAFELLWQATAVGDARRVQLAGTIARDAPQVSPELFELYGALRLGPVPKPLVERLAALATKQAAAAQAYYQNFYVADIELAVAAGARSTGDHARAHRSARQALAHLDKYASTLGVTSGLVARRIAWARELVRLGLRADREP